MYSIWTPVKVTNAMHARAEQAGTVFATNPDHPDEVAVKFDSGEVEAVNVTDIKAL